MKRRVRKIANFFAFNLLFFALYLNFIHKDKMTQPVSPAESQTTAFSGPATTVQEQKKDVNMASGAEQPTDELSGSPLKLSIN